MEERCIKEGMFILQRQKVGNFYVPSLGGYRKPVETKGIGRR
jgi:hypothetical protein